MLGNTITVEEYLRTLSKMITELAVIVDGINNTQRELIIRVQSLELDRKTNDDTSGATGNEYRLSE